MGCIVCNCDDVGLEFLDKFSEVQKKMKEASVSMLQCSKVAKDIGTRRRYDKVHKKMVKILKDWNKIEHERERCTDAENRLETERP